MIKMIRLLHKVSKMISYNSREYVGRKGKKTEYSKETKR